MENDEIKRNNIEKFLKEIFKEEIYKEKDTEIEKTIYMPQSIKKLLEEPIVNRMNRILQLGTNMYDEESLIGTRMQHSKGTYSIMLDLLANLWENDNEFKKYVEEKNYPKYVKAILLKTLLHDLGQGPFSHTLETVCNLPKGFHEDIGKRLIAENESIRTLLNNIEPQLPELIVELEQKDILGLNRLCEGQFDVDRADFTMRDNYFFGKDSKKSKKIIQEIIESIRIKKITTPEGQTNLIPVLEEKQVENLENFLQNRYNNYIGKYMQEDKFIFEVMFKAFAERLMESEEKSPLKDYFNAIMNQKSENVDLDKYVSYNDIEYLKEIVRIVKTTKDDNLRILGLMTLPPYSTVPGLYYGVMISSNKRVSVEEQLSESDEQFIRDMKEIEKMRRQMGKDKDFIEQNCILVHTDGNAREKVKQVLEENNPKTNFDSIKSWTKKVSFYKNKPQEEIYIMGTDSQFWEYSNYPNRTKEIQHTNIQGTCILVPELRIDGFGTEEIEKVRSQVALLSQDREQHVQSIE